METFHTKKIICLIYATKRNNNMPEHAVDYHTKREKRKLAKGVWCSRVENCYFPLVTDR